MLVKIYELTEEQNAVRAKAIELLQSNFDCKSSPSWKIEYQINDEFLDSEYDTCDSDKCKTEMLKHIRKQQKNKEFNRGMNYKKVEAIDCYNGSDHEQIERCAICDIPLNESLTWIDIVWSEIEDIPPTKENVQCYYYDLYVILNSIPSNDNRSRTEYSLKLEYSLYDDEYYEADKELFESVLKWAEFIVANYSA